MHATCPPVTTGRLNDYLHGYKGGFAIVSIAEEIRYCRPIEAWRRPPSPGREARLKPLFVDVNIIHAVHPFHMAIDLVHSKGSPYYGSVRPVYERQLPPKQPSP